MLELIFRRLAIGVITLFATSLVFFLGGELVPGDFASEMARMRASIGERLNYDTMEMIREALGLYRPVHVRYFEWLNDVLHGHFGWSWAGEVEVSHLIAKRLPNTLLLAAATTVVAVPLSVGIGIISAARQGSVTDRLSTTFSLTAMSVPEFVMAYLLVFLLAVTFPLFPALAISVSYVSWPEKLRLIALPVLTLTLTMVAGMSRLTRAAVIDVLGREFIVMARLKGMTTGRILLHHAMPHAIAPIINIVILSIAGLLVGTFVVEYVFAYPGIGQLMLEAVRLQHMPVVQACGLIFAATYILLVMLADIISIVANPRIAERELPAMQRMRIKRHDAPIYSVTRHATAMVGVVLLIGGPWLASHYGQRGLEVADFDLAVRPPDSAQRRRITAEELFAPPADIVRPVHNAFFAPVGEVLPATHEFRGWLSTEPAQIIGQRPQQTRVATFGTFPGLKQEFYSHAGYLIPVNRAFIEPLSKADDWGILLSPGRVWTEAGDGGLSRAAFPFTLIGPRWGVTRNGLATFVYSEESVSDLRFQIVQEAAPGDQWDAAGQASMDYEPAPASRYDRSRQSFLRELEQRESVRPYGELSDRYDSWALSVFDGRYNRRNITISGVIIEDVVYASRCRTRFGDYPYCGYMYHGVYGVTKSLGAMVAMLWLAEKYGEQVFDLRILDYAPVQAGHDGWRGVTFADALNMATGIGSLEPKRIEGYVESDRTPLAENVRRARGAAGKLEAVAGFANYPWGPGEVFRYRTADTFVLAMAMENFLRSRQGPQARLWQALSEEVFVPIGVHHLPMLHTREPDGGKGVPLLGDGLLLTVDDLAKLVRLLRNGGRHGGRQILSARGLSSALRGSGTTGLRTGWFSDDGEGRYHMSLWLIPYEAHFGCRVSIPTMSGWGGNYVLLMPNGITAFRFADGRPSNPGTWDSSWMRYVTDYMRPLCK